MGVDTSKDLAARSTCCLAKSDSEANECWSRIITLICALFGLMLLWVSRLGLASLIFLLTAVTVATCAQRTRVQLL